MKRLRDKMTIAKTIKNLQDTKSAEFDFVKLLILADSFAVDRDQNYDKEETNFIFADGSALCISGLDRSIQILEQIENENI